MGLLHLLIAASTSLQGAPELPRSRVDITLPVTTGRTIHVKAADDLQLAIEAAKPGDEIALEAGAVFTGPFTLPAKAGKGWIVIRSSSSNLLPAGRRVTPAEAPLMPKLEARFGAVISAEAGAHHYRFVGLEMRPAKGVSLGNVVLFGIRETSLAELPHHLILDRCFIHGDKERGSRRGVNLGSRESAVIDSWFSDFKEAPADSQAIAGWNGTGPFLIENNYLEGAGENVMFGGADPSIKGLVPSDIEILRNHFQKPLSWKGTDPSYAGASWTIKNLLELKNARRVLIANNLFEQNWVGAQSGFAILFTVRNQDGKAPWSVVEDVTFENNVVRHTAAGINVLGRDDAAPSERTARIAIRNNLFDDVGGEGWGGGGKLFQILQGARDVRIEHNTALQTGPIVMAEGPPSPGFIYRDNIAPHNAHGIAGSGVASGLSTRQAFFPDGVFRGNVIVGGDESSYPAGNFFPASLDDVGFTERARRNYRLKATSAYRRAASDGADVGADFDRLRTALSAGTVPTPPPIKTASWDLLQTGPAIAQTAFWASVALLVYTNVGYPFLLLGWARVWPRPFRTGHREPTITIVIAGHNEASRVEARIANLLSLDYPENRVDILIGLDGCSDNTAARARACASERVRVVEFETRRGKPSVLNSLLPLAKGEIVVFGDMRQRFGRGALKALVAPFTDPAVGAVSGELILTEADGRPLEKGLGFYWRCEKAVRRAESEIGSVVGVTGAVYAMRRELFEALPEDTILDDVLVPMRVTRRGYRVVFEPLARAYDAAGSSLKGEFARKVRTISGNFQLFTRERWLLGPKNPLLVQTVSHKALRLLTPLLLVLALLTNLALLDRPVFQLLLMAQIAFYLTAIFGHSLRNLKIPGLAIPYVVCMLASATTMAFFRHLAGRQKVTWAREGEA